MATTLHNDFHHTSATVRPAADGTVSARAWARAARRLCGMDCTCGTVRGPQAEGVSAAAGQALGAEPGARVRVAEAPAE